MIVLEFIVVCFGALLFGAFMAMVVGLPVAERLLVLSQLGQGDYDTRKEFWKDFLIPYRLVGKYNPFRDMFIKYKEMK